MKTELQGLDFFEEKVKRLLIRNKNRSVSALFRQLRSNSKLSLIGDYPILSFIFDLARRLDINYRKNIISYSLNQSAELKPLQKKEKTILIEQLSKPSYVELKWQKNVQISDF